MTQEEKASFLLNYCHISPLGLLTCPALAFCSLWWSQTPCPQPTSRQPSPAPGFGIFQKQWLREAQVWAGLTYCRNMAHWSVEVARRLIDLQHQSQEKDTWLYLSCFKPQALLNNPREMGWVRVFNVQELN